MGLSHKHLCVLIGFLSVIFSWKIYFHNPLCIFIPFSLLLPAIFPPLAIAGKTNPSTSDFLHSTNTYRNLPTSISWINVACKRHKFPIVFHLPEVFLLSKFHQVSTFTWGCFICFIKRVSENSFCHCHFYPSVSCLTQVFTHLALL